MLYHLYHYMYVSLLPPTCASIGKVFFSPLKSCRVCDLQMHFQTFNLNFMPILFKKKIKLTYKTNEGSNKWNARDLPKLYSVQKGSFSTSCLAERIFIWLYCRTKVKFSALTYDKPSMVHLIYFSVFLQNHSSIQRKGELLIHRIIEL